MGCACSCGGSKTASGFTDVTSHSAGCMFARQVIGTVDSLRDLYTAFGLRIYKVRIIKTRWSAGRRGQGVEEIFFERVLEPTPLVLDLGALTEIVQPVGLDEIGAVRVEQISGRYTEDMLRGHDDEGNGPGAEEQIWWEIEFINIGTGNSLKRRFFIRSAPMYIAEKFQWVVTLEKSNENRARNGDLR